jgi:L-cysteine S-thiosulfotransferase
MKIKTKHVLFGLAAAALFAGCASVGPRTDLNADFAAMMKSSFRSEGIATTDRLQQDLGQSACSSPKPPPPEVAKRIEEEALATIKWPAGGQYFGNWEAGEKLAQSGRGMTWSDKTSDTKENGGQCYNCHQIDKKEISFGTIGPSLTNYGKIRGVKSLSDASSAAVIQYTWGKLWNSKAYVACSNMPRFGHMKLLDESQIRDVMSLLLDPRSPVNN